MKKFLLTILALVTICAFAGCNDIKPLNPPELGSQSSSASVNDEDGSAENGGSSESGGNTEGGGSSESGGNTESGGSSESGGNDDDESLGGTVTEGDGGVDIEFPIPKTL